MGRKVPMWQCIIAILAMVVFLFWNVMKDDGGEALGGLILAVVGAMIGCWKAGGVIPSMMYYGIKIISPKIFLFTACILCSIVSLATGSSWSTAGSMGVAIIGIGTACCGKC